MITESQLSVGLEGTSEPSPKRAVSVCRPKREKSNLSNRTTCKKYKVSPVEHSCLGNWTCIYKLLGIISSQNIWGIKEYIKLTTGQFCKSWPRFFKYIINKLFKNREISKLKIKNLKICITDTITTLGKLNSNYTSQTRSSSTWSIFFSCRKHVFLLFVWIRIHVRSVHITFGCALKHLLI